MVLKNERVSEQHMLKDASHGTFKLAIMNWRLSDSTCPCQKKKKNAWLQTMAMMQKNMNVNYASQRMMMNWK